jgi:hypothetical protein
MELLLILFISIMVALSAGIALTYHRPQRSVLDNRADDVLRKWRSASPNAETAANRLRPADGPVRS